MNRSHLKSNLLHFISSHIISSLAVRNLELVPLTTSKMRYTSYQFYGRLILFIPFPFLQPVTPLSSWPMADSKTDSVSSLSDVISMH